LQGEGRALFPRRPLIYLPLIHLLLWHADFFKQAALKAAIGPGFRGLSPNSPCWRTAVHPRRLESANFTLCSDMDLGNKEYPQVEPRPL